ncbi:MAG TPA: tetratricopeptide repeat protein [Thermoanaerobaculia bacterium]|jgi:Tfp pilus assembly protein PilF|nr:tetratricopeptide repeat protein [Thermoanaerobaculia bacterium]
MKGMLRLSILFATLALSIGCGHQSDLTRPSVQDNFGVQMARMNLWREAMFRFERAIEINPGDAQAHNNLAVAYEANGDFEKARKEYLEALKLDRTNPYIQKNYSRFVEFLSRNKKRQAAAPKVTAAPLKSIQSGATSTSDINGGQPDRPTGGNVPPSTATNPPGAQPSDRPQPSPPTPPPTPNPPGGVL